MLKFYGYNKCATCRKAKAYLGARGIKVEEVDITTTPPAKTLLQAIVRSGAYALADLFNRSGELYRAMRMKEKVRTMGESALLDLLAKHGRLIKRPLITDGQRYTVGFDQVRMKRVWG